MLDLDRYAERVGLPRVPSPGVEALHSLHRAQALALPFENLDVLLGRTIALDLASLEAKLVRRRRGGYCFELNGLMLAVLRAAGFDARPLLARVFLQRTPADGVRGRTHQLTLVELGAHRYLVDVGFGGPTPREPIPFELERDHDVLGDRFRLVPAGELGTMLRHRGDDGEWRDLYAFTLDTVHHADLVLGNHYTSTHPESRFMGGPRIARVLPDARLTMSRERVQLVPTSGAQREWPTPRGDALIECLARDFEIDIDVAPSW